MASLTREDLSACPSCAAMLRDGLARRGFLQLATATTVGLALAPLGARAQAGGTTQYRAMLLSCVDPRTQAPIADWMSKPAAGSHSIGLTGLYSQVTIAGAAVGAVAPAFADWRKTFWDNLGASIQLHGIRTLVVVDHADCGALGIAYGQRVQKDAKLELTAHAAVVKRLQDELAVHHPDLDYQAWFVHRDAQGKFTQWKSLIDGPVID